MPKQPMTPRTSRNIYNENQYNTPTKTLKSPLKRVRTPSLKALENLTTSESAFSDDEDDATVFNTSDSDKLCPKTVITRRSTRKCSSVRKYKEDYILDGGGEPCGDGAKRKPRRLLTKQLDEEEKRQLHQRQDDNNDAQTEDDDNTENEDPIDFRERQHDALDMQLIQDEDVAGRNMFGFHTPKKRGGMAYAVLNTPKTPMTPKTPRTIKVAPKMASILLNTPTKTKTPKSAKTPKSTKTPKSVNTPKTAKTPKSAVTPKTTRTPKSSKTPKTPKSALQEPKTPETRNSRKSITETKTPSRLRQRLRSEIAKIVEESSNSDFSSDDSEFEPNSSDENSSDNNEDHSDDSNSIEDDAVDDEPKTPNKSRHPIVVPVFPKTPTAARLRQSARIKRTKEFVPESDVYFDSHANSKILTSNNTLDSLKNPRLPADRIFSLLAEMKISTEHEEAVNAIMEEYRTYFSKWLYVLNEGFNILLYGLGSKRQLLQAFHREILEAQPVLVINGFFPSLLIKDILDGITNDILDAGLSASNPHEAVDMIEEEFAQIPQTHLYLIVHNLDGIMLRNNKTQSILARLSKVPNIHLLASIDHINTPLLWDHTKLRNFNFSWWDCTTMLPYKDETAFENSLLVQNSGELALSSMRSVFSSMTINSRGIYMLIVNYQLKNKTNSTYQGMTFKDLYSKCREKFLVSSDLALRANLTEFLDHKLVKSKRNIDGTELLTIPIDSKLLQQFLEEQEKK